MARNGRQFLAALMNREIRNYQFDFLRGPHSNFNYFTRLVEQYTKASFTDLVYLFKNSKFNNYHEN